MNIYKPFTYLIGWSDINVWYYGVRYKKKCSTDDLWSIYFTSSKHVKDFRLEHGEPDVIEIRRTFDTVENARLWEDKVLRRLRVIYDDKWLNRSYGNDAFYNRTLSIEHKKKLSIAKIGKKHTEDTKVKISIKNSDSRTPHTQERKNNISLAMKGLVRPKLKCQHCETYASASSLSRWHNEKCKHSIQHSVPPPCPARVQ
jgi:hypothetical protein